MNTNQNGDSDPLQIRGRSWKESMTKGNWGRWRMGLGGLVLAWLVVGMRSEAASFQGLGRLPGGEAYSRARAVSADG